MLIAHSFELAETMRKALSQIILSILALLITACAATNTTVGEKIFVGDSALRNESIRNGDHIFIVTEDENELLMLVSSYNSEKVSGYVTSNYDKSADEYYFYDEVDGKTDNHQGVKAIDIDHIGLVSRATRTRAVKTNTPNISGSDVAKVAEVAAVVVGCVALAFVWVDCSHF